MRHPDQPIAGELLRLDPDDDVLVALRDLNAGTMAVTSANERVTVLADIAQGHKVASRPLAAGEPLRKYGQLIGVATTEIRQGDHVHVHNLGMPTAPTSRHRATKSAKPLNRLNVPQDLHRTFQGIRRADGSVGTRNYIGVLTTVNCSATVARQAVRRTEIDVPERFPGVDGVVALTHGTGCGMANAGLGWDNLQRTLLGYARHPNIGALVVIGLGCEVNEISQLVAAMDIAGHVPVESFTIQEAGGTVAAIDHGVQLITDMAKRLVGTSRVSCGIEHLRLGLQCGGSDGWSGLTANPALGVASDLIVAAGGTSLLGETPEIFGAEHLLAERAVNSKVALSLLDRIEWWKEYTAASGTSMDGNPSPGNKAGGITTILEKSLGAVAKAGRSPLAGVLRYAEPISGPGLLFMDTPGYDPVSATGMIAGGANLIAFTTGRGSVFGSRPVPTVKLSTNSQLAMRMAGDIDLDCSPVVESGTSLLEMGRRVYDVLLETASGRLSKSEELGLGGEEMVPWQLGAVL